MKKTFKQPASRPWTLAKIWDEAFDKAPEEIKPRDYLYASEVGSSFRDTFYKMQGVQYTNSPTIVARRKMEAGKVWEAIVRMVYDRAGMLKACQDKIDFAIPGLLSVHGKLDFLVGGEIDLDAAAEAVVGLKALWSRLYMPEVYIEIAERLLSLIRDMAVVGGTVNLELIVNEVKSVSKYVWDMVESTGKPAAYHKMQAFHYTYGLNKPVGRVTYINRDDCRLMEIPIPNDPETYEEYERWVAMMTLYWNGQEIPPPEPLITFNTNDFKFRKNTMGVEWSRYLTLIYGFLSGQEYRDFVDPKIKSYNRVFKRCVDCEKMTALNRDVIAEAKQDYPLWDDYVDMAKMKNAVLSDDVD